MENASHMNPTEIINRIFGPAETMVSFLTAGSREKDTFWVQLKQIFGLSYIDRALV